MNALVLAALLQGPVETLPSATAYALPLPASREFSDIDRTRLTDLSYSLEDGLSALHTFGAGVQFGDTAAARVRFRGDDRTVEFEDARIRAGFGQVGGEIRGAFERTGGRSRIATGIVFHPSRNGDGGVTLEGLGTRNLSDRLDLSLRALGETKNVRFPGSDRTRRFGSLALTYQRNETFDAEVEAGWRSIHTPGALEFDESFARLRAAGTLGGAQYDVESALVDRTGKYAVRNASYIVKGAIPLRPRLLLETDGDARHEFGGGVREYRVHGALTLFARKVRLSRSGHAGRRASDLARLARESGYFERARFESLTDQTHRGLRQRVSLRDPANDRLVTSAQALHVGEVQDRNVPLLGVSYETASRSVAGESSRTLGLNVSVPWPARVSLANHEGATRFLRLDLLRRRTVYGIGVVAFTKSAGVTLELNRELELRTSLTSADATPIERLKGIGSYRIFSVAFAYVYGR